MNRCEIFRSRADRIQFLRLLAAAVPRFRLSCWAFCLMSNHYHLVLETRQPRNPVRAGICATAADWPWSRLRRPA